MRVIQWSLGVLLYFTYQFCTAQPQIWGFCAGSETQLPGSPYANGSLFRLNANGMEPEFLYAFDTTTVRWPNAMVQAANGKIYATVPDGPGVEQDGYIWEYDPVLDTLIVRYYFSSGASSSWLSVVRVGLVEGPDNMLYGFGRSADQSTPLNAVSLPIFKYNTLSNTIAKESAISGYYCKHPLFRHSNF